LPDDRWNWSVQGKVTCQWAAPVQWGLELLASELHWAFGAEPSKYVKRDRIRVYEALTAVARFLGKFGMDPYGYEFLELSIALQDLEAGVPRAFFVPSARKGRPEDSSHLYMCRAYVAVAVECLVQGNWQRRKAAKWIESEYGFLADFLAPTSKNFAGTVEAWHKRFSGNKILNPFGRQVYNTESEAIPMIAGWLKRDGFPDVATGAAGYMLYRACIMTHDGLDKDQLAKARAAFRRATGK
jgi:hypothetical protein